MKMDGSKAFRIARVDHVEGGLIAASGRAYRDLHIGDVLHDHASRREAIERPSEFEIVGITTYGRTVQSLARMLTGVLLLRGRDDGAPRSEMLLAKQAHPQQSAVVHHIPAS
jgi:hypothetical protein